MKKSIIKFVVSIIVSIFLVGLLLNLVSGEHGDVSIATIVDAAKSAIMFYIAIYLVCQLFQTFFRAARAKILLKSAGTEVKLTPMILVTFVRGAFVDMLPARIGELSYVALLKRGCGIAVADGLSSLSISVLFDFIGLLLVFAVALPLATNSISLVGSVIMLILLCIVGGVGIFYILPYFGRLAERIRDRFTSLPKFMVVLLNLLADTATSVVAVRKSGKLLQVLLLSVCVRACKYIGLLFLFQSVVIPLSAELAAASSSQVVLALIGAEGSAALPVPSFMSFGTYETGGISAFKLMGFGEESLKFVVIAMFAMHFISQIIDYSLGAISLIAFVWKTDSKAEASENTKSDKKITWQAMLRTGVLLGTVAIALGFLLLSYRSFVKGGRLTPPPKGSSIEIPAGELQQRVEFLNGLEGRIVWSSNRDGLHSIYSQDIASGEITRLTNSGFTDTYPILSPDGTRFVFSRSTEPWVSLRNMSKWDTYLYDFEKGEECLLATNAFMAVWDPSGRSVVFMRNNASELVQATLVEENGVITTEDKVILKSGVAPIAEGTQLTIPDINDTEPSLLVTLRGRMNYIASISKDGKKLQKIDSGCQAVWRKSGSTEFAYMNHPGKQKNSIFWCDALNPPGKIFFDSESDYSHEYFPRFSQDGDWLVYGASTGGHEQDSCDYEIFLMNVETKQTLRITYNTSNDSWPDIFVSNIK